MTHLRHILLWIMLIAPFLAPTARAQQIAIYSGTGVGSTPPFTVDGPWIAQWTTDAESISVFAWEAGDPESVYPGMIAMQTEPGVGDAYVDQGGTYYFKIACPGPWAIRVLDYREVMEETREDARTLKGLETLFEDMEPVE